MKVLSTFTYVYHPEIGVSNKINLTDAYYYQSLVGVLHLIVELGQANITTKVYMMASYMAMQRKGYL